MLLSTLGPELGGIKIEGKGGLKSRLGRSPDKADALAYACWKSRAARGQAALVTL